MINKLIITPWFGPLPVWFDRWKVNFDRLGKYGYNLLMPTDLDDFKKRCADKLGITECPVEYGKAKVHDYRAVLGILYEEELKDYEFYGHTDFDCVYGRVDKWVTDDLLGGLDILSNHLCAGRSRHWDGQVGYICGPWTLYRNVREVNNIFRDYPTWKEVLEEKPVSGWVEKEFSNVVDQRAKNDIRLKYVYWQGHNPDITTNLRWRGESLYDGEDEIMMFHFNRTKVWPHAL